MKDFFLVFGVVLICIVIETLSTSRAPGTALLSIETLKEHGLMYLLFIGIGGIIFYLRRNRN